MLDPIPRHDGSHLGPTASTAAAILNPLHHGVGHLGLSPPRWQPSWTQHLPPPCMEAAILDPSPPWQQPSWTRTPMAAAILDCSPPWQRPSWPPPRMPPPFPACTGGCGATPPIEPH
ncbi:transcriptional repressor rco-1-like [Strigops habroptila]|uniref:transcriptional repressor rco-1-like n=1 Tax=Strigops habroptila TaxID=2489341 RepID=UPI0011CEE9FA|nr:transcriptional repressor rco-1-like [Strigops habroptila]